MKADALIQTTFWETIASSGDSYEKLVELFESGLYDEHIVLLDQNGELAWKGRLADFEHFHRTWSGADRD